MQLQLGTSNSAEFDVARLKENNEQLHYSLEKLMFAKNSKQKRQK